MSDHRTAKLDVKTQISNFFNGRPSGAAKKAASTPEFMPQFFIYQSLEIGGLSCGRDESSSPIFSKR
jgi:hypothetical protein